MINKANFHIHTIVTSEETDNWCLPRWIFSYYCTIFNIRPKIDCCAFDTYNLCDKYFTKKDDMFKQTVKEDFYMNPMYSRIDECMEWAWQQVEENGVSALICVNANVGSGWFQTYIWKPFLSDIKQGKYGKRVLLEFHSRIKFLNRYGQIPKHKGQDGIERENVAMYYSAFCKIFAGSIL